MRIALSIIAGIVGGLLMGAAGALMVYLGKFFALCARESEQQKGGSS